MKRGEKILVGCAHYVQCTCISTDDDTTIPLSLKTYFLPHRESVVVTNKTGNVRINVTLRRVRVTTVAVEYYILWVCVCSLRYLACEAHAPYYIAICDLSGSTIFFLIISQTARFLGRVTENKMCVLFFPTTLVRSIPRSKKNCMRYYHKCVLLSCKVAVVVVVVRF